jgi:hypothetical protein
MNNQTPLSTATEQDDFNTNHLPKIDDIRKLLRSPVECELVQGLKLILIVSYSTSVNSMLLESLNGTRC